MHNLPNKPDEGIQQVGKILSEIVSNLREHPVFLFGIASMLIAVVGTWILVFTNYAFPEPLAWFPYALLAFGILVILFDPSASISKTKSVENLANDSFEITPQSSLTNAVIETLFRTKTGRLEIVFYGLYAVWGCYFGSSLGYGLDSVWSSIYSWIRGNLGTQVNYGWIIGSSIIGLVVSIVAIVAVFFNIHDEGDSSTYPAILVLLFGIAAITLVVPITALVLSPFSALTWWLSKGNTLITAIVTFSILAGMALPKMLK